jgi:drug/metabolite transporter (DMT)-like permease
MLKLSAGTVKGRGSGQRTVADRQRGLGVVLTTISAVAYSTAGFFTRLIPLDVWTVLFWRGIFAGLFIAAFIVWQYRKDTLAVARAVGVPGLVAASLSTLATICFINAFRRTSVADVTVIYATAPFVTAALGWLWIGERENWTTLLASAVAFVGVVVMVGGAVAEGHILGDLLACGMTLCMAVLMVIIRKYRDTPMLPASCLSAFGCSLLVWPLAAPAAAGLKNLGYLALFGTTQFGLGLLLLTLGTRLISATQSALISALETPLGPLWVWLAFQEVPPLATLVGGAIVMAAVLAYIVTSSRSPGPGIPERAGDRRLSSRAQTDRETTT